MIIKIAEYNFEINDNQVKVFDTSLNKYVGAFEIIETVITKEICEKWLNQYYEW